MNTPNGAADLLSFTPDHDHSSPPLQLPKVGWDDDDDDDQELPTDPPAAQVPIPTPARSSLSLRNNSNRSSSELELQPIPEDMSMHGPWPDYSNYCNYIYDYDEDRKKVAYGYRLCGCILLPLRCRGIVTIVCFCVLLLVVVTYGPMTTTAAGGNSNNNSSGEQPMELTQEQQAHLYEKVATIYHPLWYDRSRGWNGTAYLQSYEFCGTLPAVVGGDHQQQQTGEYESSRVPCPFVAYCPLGRGYPPYGGVRSDASGGEEGWAPVLDGENEWVQVGSSNPCQLYSDIHNEPPRWGFTGENDEVITQNIMCCLKPRDEDDSQQIQSYNNNKQPEEDVVVNSDVLHRPPDLEDDEQDGGKMNGKTATTTAVTSNEAFTESNESSNKNDLQSNNNPPIQQLSHHEHAQISNEDLQHLFSYFDFEPVWFDKTYGLSLTGADSVNTQDAQDFCYNKAGRRSNKAGRRSICPYVAYCPEGPDGIVMEGHTSTMRIEWAPMKEWNGFHWVGIGTDNTCWQAKDVGEFGMDALGEDGVKVDKVLGYIMCCKEKEEVDP